MSERPGRSRARSSTIQNRNRTNASRKNGGNAKRMSTSIAFGAVALIAIIGAIILLVKHNSVPLLGHGTSAPNHTQTGLVAETHELSTDMPQDTMGMMDTAMPSESPAPGDTPAAGPMESVQNNDSASPEPGATQTHDETVDTSTSATVEIRPITGKADVENHLSLRSEASTSASIITEIPKGSIFTIMQVNPDPSWLEVEYDGKYGYVLAKYVIIQDNQSNQVCTITSITVNVRHGAGKDKELVAELHKGDTVIVKEQKATDDGTWYKIAIGDLIGYVSSEYCRLASNG